MKINPSAFSLRGFPYCFLCGLLATGPVAAGSLDLSVPNDPSFGATPPVYSRTLASNDMTPDISSSGSGLSFTKDNEQYEESWLTGSKAHQYMGLGALALVALAAVSPKEEDSAHEYFAVSATALAAGAATTGFIYHWDDFHFADGFTDPDNLHMMLGLLGTIAMVAAVSEAPEAGHSGPGILGGVAMGAAVKITW